MPRPYGDAHRPSSRAACVSIHRRDPIDIARAACARRRTQHKSNPAREPSCLFARRVEWNCTKSLITAAAVVAPLSHWTLFTLHRC